MGPRTGRTLALAWLALAAGACSRHEPIRIGFVSGLTGRHYDLGISSRNGVTLAVRDVNAAGGIDGRPLEVLVRDDEQDPAAALRAVRELVDAGVVAIVGHATSSMAEVTLPIVDRERVLMVSPTVSASEFQGKDDWLVLLYPSTRSSARHLARFLRERGYRRFSAFLDLSNAAYSRSWHDEFKAEIEARGGAVVRSQPFTSGQVASYSALVRRGVAPGSDAVLVIANALDFAAIAQQLRKFSNLQIVGTDWAFTSDVLSHGGSAVEGAIFPQKVNLLDTSPRFARFGQAYEDRFNRPPDFAAILSYEAVLVLADALRRDATREGVRRAILASGGVEGLQGRIAIDRTGDAQRRNYVMAVRGGRLSSFE